MSEQPSTHAADPLASTVLAAQAGDAAALERLMLSVHDRVYHLSLRMTARPPDAEDATQEILIRVITRLSTFRGEAAFLTWVHRIAVNHLLDRSKNRVEQLEITFDAFAADLLDGLASSPSADPDAGILEREVQLACTHAMLTCLDRDHRIAYILGEIFSVDSDDGGYICEVPPATYRKRLSRARLRVRGFLTDHCGLVSPTAPCHCSKRVDVAVRLGRVDRQRLEFTDFTTSVNDEMVRFHEAADLLRCLPTVRRPAATIEVATNLVRNSTAASAMTLPSQGDPRGPDGPGPSPTTQSRAAAGPVAVRPLGVTPEFECDIDQRCEINTERLA